MEAKPQTVEGQEQIWYARLDRYLLYLLAGELGYFILLVLAGIVVIVLGSAYKFTLNLFDTPMGPVWPVLIYVLALPFNLGGGLASLILNIRTRHQGYPGTGHLLNWVFLATTAWLFLFGFLVVFPTLTRGD